MANNTDRNERLFDAILKVAAEEATIQEMDEFPSREELEKLYPRSEAFDKRIAKIIGKHDRKEKIKKAARIFASAAAAVGIFFTVGFITLISVEASRNFILNVIISVRDDHVAFEFRDSANIPRPSNYASILEEILPIGFEYEASHHLEAMTIYSYSNDAGEFLVFQRLLGESAGIHVSETNREFSIMDIGNQTVYVFDAYVDGYGSLILWAEGEFVYKITSYLDIDTLINIAATMIAR